MHAVKEIVISTTIRWIAFISRCYGGKHHDYSVLKSVLPADKEWFKKFKVRVDLGFLGFAKDYVCRKVFIPIKKPKGKELTDEQREINTKQASERITVEHSIGRLKTFSKARQCILPLKALFALVTLLVLANDFSETRFLAILDSRALLNVFSLIALAD